MHRCLLADIGADVQNHNHIQFAVSGHEVNNMNINASVFCTGSAMSMLYKSFPLPSNLQPQFTSTLSFLNVGKLGPLNP